VVLTQNLQGSDISAAALPDGETQDPESSLSEKRTGARRHVIARAWNQITIALNHIKSWVNPSGIGMLRNMRSRRDGNLRICQSMSARIGLTIHKISAQNTPAATTSSRK
jgi:hypothetical protein